MPKTKFQEVIFGVLMVTVMAYFMATYNIALHTSFDCSVLLKGLGAFCIVAPIAFIIEYFFVGKLARKLAFRMVNPAKDRPIVITLAISCMTVALMCPIMSLIATTIFNWSGAGNILANWIEAWVLSFPAALLWNLFYGGPLARFIFKRIFRQRQVKTEIKLARDYAKTHRADAKAADIARKAEN